MAERDPNKFYFKVQIASEPNEPRWFAINKNLFKNADGVLDVNLAANFIRSMMTQPEAEREFGRTNWVRLYGEEQGDLPEGVTFNSPVGTTNPGNLAYHVDFGDFTDVNWWDLKSNARIDYKGNGNGNGGPYEPPEVAGIPGIEQQFPRGAYMAGMGDTDRSTIKGPFARYFDAQFSPTAATYMARSALGQEMLGEGDEGGQHFQRYVGSTPSGRVPIQALAALKGILDPLARERYEGGLTSSEQEMALQAFTDPQTSFQRGQAASLARSAAGGKFSPFAVANLFPGAEQVAQEWEATPQRPFLKYVAQRYGLGNLLNP